MKKIEILIILSFLSNTIVAQERKTLKPTDYYNVPALNSPIVSADGKWIVYTISKADSALDKINTDLHMVSWDGKDTVQLTSGPDPETSPQFSPDGKYISFLSSRGGDKTQVWLLDRRGGEAKKLTNEKSSVSSYSWSPDSKKMVLAVKDSLDSTLYNKRKPYVIDRYQFKEDYEGYVYEKRKIHLYIFDINAGKSQQITSGDYDDVNPAWSPLGNHIVFVSNRSADPDRNRNTDLWIIDAKGGASPRQLTTWKGSDDNPRFSPDGKNIAYTRSTSDANSEYYEQPLLCVVPVAGGTSKIISQSIDRPVFNHRWTPDGKSVAALVADDTRRYIGIFDAQSGSMTKLAEGDRTFTFIEPHSKGNWIAVMSEPTVPGELYNVSAGEIRKITHAHDAFINSRSFAHVEKFQSKSKDGTNVSGLIYYPPNLQKREKLPVVFYLHGGPVAQDEFGFDLTRQMFAAHGFATVGVNYRGSSGRGHEFSHTITGDWGNKEVMDILGAADFLVQKGVADPNRLGICGWSYGGMLTTYTIAKDGRFKAAISGAGSAFPLSLYGVDEYAKQYDNEIGAPWIKGNLEKYMKISYPFFNADKIKTPTLFMGGEKDFNVPIIGGEQMYQALKSIGVPTQLVVYPGQYHGFSQPSFIVDRFERYISWFHKYLGK